MNSMEALIKTMGITRRYLRSVEGGVHGGDHDVYACFLSRETEEVSLYGGRYNSVTLYLKEFHQAPALSRRYCGDNLNPPDIATILEAVVADAAAIDNTSDFGDWAATYFNDTLISDAEALMETYRDQVRGRDQVAEFLGREDWDVISEELDALML